MAAIIQCVLLDCSQFPCTRAPFVRRLDGSRSFGCSVLCKSQRNSRYEKSKKHARQGQATIPHHTVVAPSRLRTDPAQAKAKPSMEARKERSSSGVEHGQKEESKADPHLQTVSAMAIEELQPAVKENPAKEAAPADDIHDKVSGSHWDDFWAPRLFWVFRALGTVVD